MTTYEELIENARYFVDQLEPGEVHIVMALARKKYNQELPSATDYRKIGIWREIVTKKDFENKIKKIWTLAKHYAHEIAKPEDYNFYITHNPRSPHKALKQFKAYLALYDCEMNSESLLHLQAEWFSCLQQKAGRARKVSFVLDADTKDCSVLANVLQNFNPVLKLVETRNGYHILIPPQRLETTRTPGQVLLKGYTDVEVGYDRLVYIGRVL